MTIFGEVVYDEEVDEAQAVSDLNAAIVLEKAQYKDVQTVCQKGLLRRFLSRQNRTQRDLVKVQSECLEAERSKIKLIEKKHDLELNYDRHVRMYRTALATLEIETGKTMVLLVYETFAGEYLRDHLAGNYFHQPCRDFLEGLRTDGDILRTGFQNADGHDTWELVNKYYAKWKLLQHTSCCKKKDGKPLLLSEILTADGVPIIFKKRKDVEMGVEATAYTIWESSKMAHHLLDHQTGEIVLWRGERSDIETLLLSTIMGYLDLAHIVKLPIKKKVIADAANTYIRATHDEQESRNETLHHAGRNGDNNKEKLETEVGGKSGAFADADERHSALHHAGRNGDNNKEKLETEVGGKSGASADADEGHSALRHGEASGTESETEQVEAGGVMKSVAFADAKEAESALPHAGRNGDNNKEKLETEVGGKRGASADADERHSDPLCP